MWRVTWVTGQQSEVAIQLGWPSGGAIAYAWGSNLLLKRFRASLSKNNQFNLLNGEECLQQCNSNKSWDIDNNDDDDDDDDDDGNNSYGLDDYIENDNNADQEGLVGNNNDGNHNNNHNDHDDNSNNHNDNFWQQHQQ